MYQATRSAWWGLILMPDGFFLWNMLYKHYAETKKIKISSLWYRHLKYDVLIQIITKSIKTLFKLVIHD